MRHGRPAALYRPRPRDAVGGDEDAGLLARLEVVDAGDELGEREQARELDDRVVGERLVDDDAQRDVQRGCLAQQLLGRRQQVDARLAERGRRAQRSGVLVEHDVDRRWRRPPLHCSDPSPRTRMRHPDARSGCGDQCAGGL